MSDQRLSPTDTDDQQPDRLLEHSYDGIQEYDNPLPRWWVMLFWVTIVFTPIYVVYYHFGPGRLPDQRYEVAMEEYADLLAERAAAMGEVDEETLLRFVDTASMVTTGQELFVTNCSQCHGPEGGGLIGPNLTDDAWIHGGMLTDVYRTIREGVPDKGMLAWEGQMRPDELLAVTAYVGSIRDTDVPGGKPAEGVEVEYDPTAAAATSDEAEVETAEPPSPVGGEEET